MVIKKGMTLDVETNTIDLEINTMIEAEVIDMKSMGRIVLKEEKDDKDMIEGMIEVKEDREDREEIETTMDVTDIIEIVIIIDNNSKRSQEIQKGNNLNHNKNRNHNTDFIHHIMTDFLQA